MATYQWVNRDTFSLDELVMYGSSRLGTYGVNAVLCDTVIRDSAWCAEHDTSTNPFTDSVTYFTAGLKQYEFTNHLGNVLLTLTDRHIPFYFGGVSYIAEVASAQDYYPFGMEMVGRAYNPALYRFGFNGKENVNEVEGIGNSIDFGARVYDSRLGRWLSLDPQQVKHPGKTPYQFVSDNPLNKVDIDGKDDYIFHYITFSTSYKINDQIKTVTKTYSYAEVTRNSNANSYTIHNVFVNENLVNDKYTVNEESKSVSGDQAGEELSKHWEELNQVNHTYLSAPNDISAHLAALNYSEAKRKKEAYEANKADDALQMETLTLLVNIVAPEVFSSLMEDAIATATLTNASTKSITTANGIEITGFTKHGINRAIGDFGRAGVKPAGILDALKNPLKIGEVITDKLGRQSQRFIGKTGEVVVNPTTGKIISVNPTSASKAAKLLKR